MQTNFPIPHQAQVQGILNPREAESVGGNSTSLLNEPNALPASDKIKVSKLSES
jgi:hypothetical protein